MSDVLDDLIEAGAAHARKVLLDQREPALKHFYHLVAPEGGTDAIVIPRWTNEFEKQLELVKVRALSRQLGAVAAMFVGEGWFVTFTVKSVKDLPEDTPRPSEHPDRIECVQIMATDGIETKSQLLRMVRHKHNPRRIIDLVAEAIPQSSIGRLIDGIIAPPKVKVQ